MWSTVTALFATMPGFRNVFAETRSPIVARVVIAAVAAAVVHASNTGCLPSRPMPMRWSHVQSESKPSSSARRATAASCSHVVCCG